MSSKLFHLLLIFSSIKNGFSFEPVETIYNCEVTCKIHHTEPPATTRKKIEYSSCAFSSIKAASDANFHCASLQNKGENKLIMPINDSIDCKNSGVLCSSEDDEELEDKSK